MAEEIKNFNLGSFTSGTTITLGSVSLGSTPIGKKTTVEAGKAANIALNFGGSTNYGSLNLTTDETLILGLNSSANGSVAITGDARDHLAGISFTGQTNVTLASSDFTALKLVNGSNNNDKFSVAGNFGSDFVLNANAGNDTIIVDGTHKDATFNAGIGNDVVSVSGGAAVNVVLGAGKDTLHFGGNATVNLTDYNFREDLIDLSSNSVSLTAQGKLESASTVVSGFTAANDLYLARLGDSSVASQTTVLATAAEDTTKVVVDASAVKAGSILINTEKADSAIITVGKGASKVNATLNSAEEAGVDTLKIAETGATVSVTATNFHTDDVLSFAGLSFDKTTIAGSGTYGASLTNGKVTVNLGSVSLATGGALFNLNGTKLYANTAAGNAPQTIDLTEESDLSKIAVKGNSYSATIASGIKTAAKLVDLSASNIYNINKVELTADTVAKASVVGTKNDKAGISIDASNAADGVAIWANNSSSKVKDIITLGNADAEDTLWFGSADGKDSVKGFQLESDVLYLYDATSMSSKDGVLKVGKAEMSVMASDTEEIMKVQGAKFAGTVYAAGDFNNDGTDVIKLGENAGKVNYYAVEKDAQVSVSAAMTDTYTFLKSFDYAGASKVGIADKGSVASIDAGATTSDSKVIIEGVANVTLGAGTNEYWANGADKNANVTLQNAAGTDKVWFSATDKNVNVTGYDTESDVIALMGDALTFTAKKDNNANAVVISNSAKGKLTVANVADYVALEDTTGAKYKLYAGTANDDVTYSTNTDGKNIFVGAGYMHADSSVTDATTLVLNGANNKWGLTSAALVDKTVKNIDMNGSSADFILVGSAATANTITGGTGTNWLNGGGASKDTLVGVTGSTDNFYFGKEDGSDIIENLGAEDKVNLYDIATTDIAAVKVSDSKTVITLKNDSKLTINGGLTDGATFVLTDGTYVYDVNGATDAEKWVKQ